MGWVSVPIAARHVLPPLTCMHGYLCTQAPEEHQPEWDAAKRMECLDRFDSPVRAHGRTGGLR
jgi:hypothetical protein